MHQLAPRHVNGYATPHTAATEVRLALCMANALDCETYSEQFSRQRSFDVLAATADLDFGLARLERLRPQVLVLDPKISANAVQRAAEMVQTRKAGHLLVLDDRLCEGRLLTLLPLSDVSYLTRLAGLQVLHSCILQIVSSGNRTFDPAVQSRIRKSGGRLRLKSPDDSASLASLTSRELEVMKLLTTGFSVRGCAQLLDLAESTVDNHKSRLMKKLDIHKIVELTHVAIREGLVVI